MGKRLRMPKWNHVLLEIHRSREHQRYCERLNRTVKCSMTHLRDVVKHLERHGLIEFKPASKVKHIEITDKGKRVIYCIMQMKSELKNLTSDR